MYCYRTDQGEICIVGFYEPGGRWIPESDHTEIRSAAARVHYLNGGVDAELIGQAVQCVCELLSENNRLLMDLKKELSHDQN